MFRKLSMAAAILAAACHPAAEEPVAATGPGKAGMQGSEDVEAIGALATYTPDLRPGGVAGGAGARLGGRLADRNGCLVIEVDGNRVFQPVFPVGRARWDRGSGRLLIGTAAYRLGDSLAVGGGAVSDREGFGRTSGTSIPKCDGAELFVVAL